MPNWIYNRIKCKKELGDKLLTINEDNYSLDFNKLIPMPEDLKLDAGTIENKSISCYYLSLSDEDKFKLMKLLKNKEVFFHHNYWNKYKSEIKNFEDNPNKLREEIDNYHGLIDFDEKKHFSNILELGKQYVENIKYDWCVENWGTKWNVEDDVDVVYDENKNENDMSFPTAWSVPSGIVEKYSELCSDDEFYWKYGDEDYDGTHIIRKINGELIDTIAPDNVKEENYLDV